MARVVRKVSNKATKGQKREKGSLIHSKKFWIILISILVVLTAAGITIGVIVANNKKKDTTVEVDDYFGQTQTFKNTEVKFTKMTYQGVRLHTNAEEGELFNDYTFVFATSLSTFYPKELKDSDGKDYKDSKHEAVFQCLIELQYEIDKFNAENTDDIKVALYIVNTDQVDGNTSYNIYTDAKISGSSSSEDNLGPLFSVVFEEGVGETANGKPIYANDFYTENKMVSSIENAINVVKTGELDRIAKTKEN